MHACLITAPTITEYRSRAELASPAVQRAALQPQLGVLGVAAIFESLGDSPQLVDVNLEWARFTNMGTGDGHLAGFVDHIADLATRSNADLYGFSSICSTYPLSLRIAAAIKALRPWAVILFGGPQASVVDVETLRAFPCVDYILRGEVEQTLPLFLAELTGDFHFDRVGGLTWRDGCRIERSGNAPVIEDLDQLLSPAYHLSSYLRQASAASVELGRGCPFSCTFCSTNDFFRRNFRLRSPARVLGEMRSIFAQYGIRHFELVHDMFTVDRKRVVRFCEEMLAAKEPFTWDCSARTDCVDEELLDLMARSGCRGIFFGIETGSRRMQRLIDKDLDPDRAEVILDLAQGLGLRTTASLITGFPQEQADDLRATVRLFLHSARCGLSQPQLNLLAPLAGTPLYSKHRDELVLDDLCSDMSHQGLTQDPDDLDLIRRFPAIFPNFYLIPTPDLDRAELFELREFFTAAVDQLRWLLCAAAQATDLLLLHADWRVWRMRHAQPGDEDALRLYYVGRRFACDFAEFLAMYPEVQQPAVQSLVQVEQVLARARKAQRQPLPQAPSECGETNLPLNAVPTLKPSTETIQIAWPLEDLIAAIGKGSSPDAPPGSAFYASRIDASGRVELVEVSTWMANTLSACDGTRTVEEVVDELAGQIPEVDMASRDYVFGRLLLGAQAAGFLYFDMTAYVDASSNDDVPAILAGAAPGNAVTR